MLIFGGTINVVPWVYVSVTDNIFPSIKSADVYSRALKSCHWKPELEELRSRSLLTGCGVSIPMEVSFKAMSNLVLRLLRCHDYSGSY